MTDNTNKTTLNLLDKDGIADLMALFNSNGYQDSPQFGINLILMGLMQLRSVGISEKEIIEAIEIQIPLADMVLGIIAGSGTDGT